MSHNAVVILLMGIASLVFCFALAFLYLDIFNTRAVVGLLGDHTPLWYVLYFATNLVSGIGLGHVMARFWLWYKR